MLKKEDIEKYLEEINNKLKTQNKYGELVIAGGAALSLIFNARESTHDIDAIFKPSIEFRKIISEIADENNLEEDWLNDGVKGFIMPNMKQEQYKKYSNLTVYSIDAKGLLAMKLTSARFMSKDLEDALFLMKFLNIKTEEELYNIVETYSNPNQLTAKSSFFIQEAFNKFKEIQQLEGETKDSDEEEDEDEL